MSPRTRVLRVGPFSQRIQPRSVALGAVMLGLVLTTALLAICWGDRFMTPREVLDSLLPGAHRLDRITVVEWRAPRALAAPMFGACLGVGGALMQALTRNPLGSPDVIGLNTGAFTGVLAASMLWATGVLGTATGAVLGGLATALIVYLLAYSRGIAGFRLIVVGIAVSSVLGSVSTWTITKADLDTALLAAVWGAGSLNGMAWEPLGWTALIAAATALSLPALARRQQVVELGEGTAQMLGVPVTRSQAGVVLGSVLLTGLVTAVAGPVAFVALAAPQIAQRVRGIGGSMDLMGSALVGALLLAWADLVAQHAFGRSSVPVGAVTVCVEGLYLLWLLIREGGRR